MKLNYKVNIDGEFVFRHIYGSRNSDKREACFSFFIENVSQTIDHVFDLSIMGFSDTTFSEMRGHVVVARFDTTKDVYELADIIQDTKMIRFEYETIVPLDLKGPFSHAFFQIFVENDKKMSMKEEITTLQNNREVHCQDVGDLENSIAVIGMKHVGSTMVFNMIRIAYKLLGKTVNQGTLTHKQEKFDVFVTKSHAVETFLTDCPDKIPIKRFVSIVRDVRDSSISSFFRFHFQQSVNTKKNVRKELLKYGLNIFLHSMHENIMLYERSLVVNPYVFYYEKYKADPLMETRRLLEDLGVPIPDDDFIAQVVDQVENYIHNEDLPIDLKDYTLTAKDRTLDTLLTRDHNTSKGEMQKWKSFFPNEHLEMILEEPIIYNFFLEHGYPLRPDDTVID